MPPAAAKSPLEYLFALAVCATTIGTSFLVDPASTKWIVFATGVVMLVAVLAWGLKPVKAAPEE